MGRILTGAGSATEDRGFSSAPGGGEGQLVCFVDELIKVILKREFGFYAVV